MTHDPKLEKPGEHQSLAWIKTWKSRKHHDRQSYAAVTMCCEGHPRPANSKHFLRLISR
jgi:hypothetical protein